MLIFYLFWTTHFDLKYGYKCSGKELKMERVMLLGGSVLNSINHTRLQNKFDQHKILIPGDIFTLFLLFMHYFYKKEQQSTKMLYSK